MANRPAGKETPHNEKPMSVYIGDGLPLVLGRIAERIRWEFMEMHELLLASQKPEEGTEKQVSRAKGRKCVRDIEVWLQCLQSSSVWCHETSQRWSRS